MSKELQHTSLLDILPQNLLRDEQIKAAAQALDAELQKITEATKEALLLPRLDELPETVIDLLAWQWHVDFYEPVGMDIETKRRLIKRSIDWHRIKGTPAAVEQVVSAAFGTSYVKEWFEYGGKPYHFKVVTEDVTTDQTVLARMRRLIDAAKNARSWLETIEFILHLQDTEKAEETHTLNVHKDTIERYPWQGRSFDGSWCFTAPERMDRRFFDGAWHFDAVPPGEEDAPTQGRIFDGAWSFDGKNDFNLNSMSRKSSRTFDGLSRAPDTSTPAAVFGGAWTLDGADNFDAPMPAVRFDSDEDASDALHLLHALAPIKERVLVSELTEERQTFALSERVQDNLLDGAWTLDGSRNHRTAYAEDAAESQALGICEGLTYGAKSDGERTFDGRWHLAPQGGRDVLAPSAKEHHRQRRRHLHHRLLGNLLLGGTSWETERTPHMGKRHLPDRSHRSRTWRRKRFRQHCAAPVCELHALLKRACRPRRARNRPGTRRQKHTRRTHQRA